MHSRVRENSGLQAWWYLVALVEGGQHISSTDLRSTDYEHETSSNKR